MLSLRPIERIAMFVAFFGWIGVVLCMWFPINLLSKDKAVIHGQEVLGIAFFIASIGASVALPVLIATRPKR